MAAPGREPDRVGCVAAVADPRDLRDLSSGSSPGGGAAVSAGFWPRGEAEPEEEFAGAIFGLYGRVREAGALVIGIASSADQARIIYPRLLAVIRGHQTLAAKFARLTDTRGIQSHNGGRYEIKPSKSAAVQGL